MRRSWGRNITTDAATTANLGFAASPKKPAALRAQARREGSREAQ